MRVSTQGQKVGEGPLHPEGVRSLGWVPGAGQATLPPPLPPPAPGSFRFVRYLRCTHART